MDYKKLKENPRKIQSILKTDGENIITTETLYLIFPERFITKDIAMIGRTVETPCIYLLHDANGNYIKQLIPTRVSFIPNAVEDIEIEGKKYKKLTFIKGAVFNNGKMVIDKDIPFILQDDWINKSGNIPFFINMDDIQKVFINGVVYGGSVVGSNPVPIATFISIIARDSKNRYVRQYYTKEQIKHMKIKFVGLSKVSAVYNNVFSAITGAYLKQGIAASLNMDNPGQTKIDAVLN